MCNPGSFLCVQNLKKRKWIKKKPESHYRSLNLVCPWKQNKNNNVVKIQFMVWDPWESESFDQASQSFGPAPANVQLQGPGESNLN